MNEETAEADGVFSAAKRSGPMGAQRKPSGFHEGSAKQHESAHHQEKRNHVFLPVLGPAQTSQARSQ